MEKSGQLFIDECEVIKRIGKGSFSNVYLCKYDTISPFFEEDADNVFIVKEINLNDLTRKYIRNKRKKQMMASRSNEKVDVNITPFNTSRYNVDKERDYYYNRLKELIESEIQLLSNINHTNIIKFYGYAKRQGIYYLRMEYCQGGDVYDYLKNTKESNRNQFNGVSNDFLVQFLQQTLDGLKYLHDHHIIHRDIKLHNILIKQISQQNHLQKSKFEFKISDLGFACFDLVSLDNYMDAQDILIKKYYKLCGTPYYMAPEIILNIHNMENITSDTKQSMELFYDKKIDIWSYGICVYELLFNILPFSNIRDISDLTKFYTSTDIQETIHKRVKDKTMLSNEFKQLLMKMLTIDPTQRCTIDEIDRKSFNNAISEEKLDGIDDLINCNEHAYLKNEKMKEHIIKNPVNVKRDIHESWEKINKSTSIIMNMSIQKGFLDWLLGK
jgi:serine/threonine protein kinase